MLARSSWGAATSHEPAQAVAGPGRAGPPRMQRHVANGHAHAEPDSDPDTSDPTATHTDADGSRDAHTASRTRGASRLPGRPCDTDGARDRSRGLAGYPLGRR